MNLDIVTGRRGIFCEQSRAEYDDEDLHSLMSTAVVAIRNRSYLLERKMRHDTQDITFFFRDPGSAKVVHTYSLPVREMYRDQFRQGSRIHSQMCINEGMVMVYLYQSNGDKATVLGVLSWSLQEGDDELRPLSECTRALMREFPDERSADLVPWRPPHVNSTLIRCQPPYLALSGEDFCLWRASDGNIFECVRRQVHSGPLVMSVSWTKSFMVIGRKEDMGSEDCILRIFTNTDSLSASSLADANGVQGGLIGTFGGKIESEAGTVLTSGGERRAVYCWEELEGQGLNVGGSMAPVFIGEMKRDVKLMFPLHGTYLDSFESGDKLVILSSVSAPSTGEMCSFCPMYRVVCSVLSLPSLRLLQQFRIGACKTGGVAHEDDDAMFGRRLYSPEGIAFGSSGPFVACSNGSEVCWYSFSSDEDASPQQLILKLPRDPLDLTPRLDATISEAPPKMDSHGSQIADTDDSAGEGRSRGRRERHEVAVPIVSPTGLRKVYFTTTGQLLEVITDFAKASRQVRAVAVLLC